MSATHFQKRLGRPDSKIMALADTSMVRLYRSATQICSGVYLTVSWRRMPPPERYFSKSLPPYASALSLPSWSIYKTVWLVTRASNCLNLAKTSDLSLINSAKARIVVNESHKIKASANWLFLHWIAHIALYERWFPGSLTMVGV